MHIPKKRLFASLSLLLSLNASISHAQDESFYILLCFGQSNIEGYPGIPDSDKTPVDPRFQVLAAVDFPELGRVKDNWYNAVPPLCRPNTELCPADYFGRTLVANLPKDKKVGIINVSVAGTRIELFDETTKDDYLATAPEWLLNFAKNHENNPYRRLVESGKLAQKDGVIKGILLHQGESNTAESERPAKVKTIYDNMLHALDLTAKEVPLIAGELVAEDQHGKCASMNKIIRSLPLSFPTAHVVSSADCPDHENDLQFTPEGYKMLGKRYAETMLPLLEKH